MKTVSFLILICALVLIGAIPVQAQSVKSTIYIAVTDSGSRIQSTRLIFALHPSASRCLDTATLHGFTTRWSETDADSLRELEAPPSPPPEVADFGFTASGCPITRLYTVMTRPYVSPVQIDTFTLRVILGTNNDGVHGAKFSWPSVLSEYADSVFLTKSGIGAFKVDMRTQSSYTYYQDVVAIGASVSGLRIIMKNPKVPPPLPSVSVIAPLINAVNVSLTPTFQWSTIPNAAYYRFQLAKDTSFTGPGLVRTDSLAGVATSLVQSSALVANTDYYWRILVSNPYGVSYWQDPPLHFTTAGAVGVEPDKEGIPSSFALGQNYPNPFNPTTEIKYQLAEKSYIELKVFDMLGREVRTLVKGVEEAGFKSVRFDAKNLPSGEYTYRLTAGAFVSTRKMMLVK
ncbi:MAG TPA: T9SS type A sorting domain-containing protein [Bacteroidota bacterium]|jgi:hypothetical protein|nr:T9SS type A sorting domain-containing protein [Bacteroidota bacterium]